MRKSNGLAVYVASAGVNRDAARAEATRLADFGYAVVSSWHEAEPFDSKNDDLLPEARRVELARQCLDEIAGADVVVIIGHPAMLGAAFEAGYAYGLGKRIEWRGDRTSIFASLMGAS